MQQYTTQSLLPRIEERIADIAYENYTIPVASNKRPIRSGAVKRIDANGLSYYAEEDYADARVKTVTATVERVFTNIADNKQAQTLARINDALTRLMTGDAVTTASLKSMLTTAQFSAYQADLQRVHDSTELLYGDGKPSALKDYNVMLNKADLMFNKYEKMAGLQTVGKRNYQFGVLRRANALAERLYERALERLEEIFSVASATELQQLKVWMDRDVVFGPNGNTSIDCVGVPRVRGSKSHQAQDAGLPRLNKRLKRDMCMLVALRDAANDIAFAPLKTESSELSAENAQLLRNKLSMLRKSR